LLIAEAVGEDPPEGDPKSIVVVLLLLFLLELFKLVALLLLSAAKPTKLKNKRKWISM
jgi:hypothetical protein